MTAETDKNIVENTDRIHVEKPTDKSIHIISPCSFLENFQDATSHNSSVRCLLILNQEIRVKSEFFKKLWSSTSLHVCADGGANRLYKYCHQTNAESSYIPDFIVGDLDSLTLDIRNFYETHKTVIKKQGSQYYSDLDKAIALINVTVNMSDVDITKLDDYSQLETVETDRNKRLELSKGITVITMGGIGGRYDQTIATISRTLQSYFTRPHMNFLLLNSEHPEFVLLLPQGKNFVNIASDFLDTETTDRRKDSLRTVGLLPLCKPARLTTKGLKWDVKDWETAISGDLSLCNLQVGDNGFYVETTTDIFANIEF